MKSTVKNRFSTRRGNGTWPNGEPESIRAAADAMPSADDNSDVCDEADALNRDLYPLSIGGLVSNAADLLLDATDLPRPDYVTVHRTQRISMQFAPSESAMADLGIWAAFFSATLTIRPIKDDYDCVVDFDYYGVHVQVYAILPPAMAKSGG